MQLSFWIFLLGAYINFNNQTILEKKSLCQQPFELHHVISPRSQTEIYTFFSETHPSFVSCQMRKFLLLKSPQNSCLLICSYSPVCWCWKLWLMMERHLSCFPSQEMKVGEFCVLMGRCSQPAGYRRGEQGCVIAAGNLPRALISHFSIADSMETGTLTNRK